MQTKQRKKGTRTPSTVGGLTNGTPDSGALMAGGIAEVGGIALAMFGSVQPTLEYSNYVESCLKEKGYEPEGWH
jgi:hypothetical protein